MKIGDKTLSEWKEFARRDDCLERMVPSDLRLILMAIEAEREACAQLAEASLMTNEDNDPWDNAVRHVAYGIRARSN